MQEEGEDGDDDSLVLIERAKEQQQHGESIALSDANDPIKCGPYLDSLTMALVNRECALGRYTYDTAQTYASMGKLYFHMHHPRAAVMFRSSYRIEYFLYGKCSGHIAGDFKGFLIARGLSDHDTEEIQKDILKSARHEVEGDILRRFGDRRAAAMEYQKAARLEEIAFGKDNPDLAFLWRKMACLASIKKANMHIVDFDDCDRVGSKWMKESKDHISTSVCLGIERGDKYYRLLLYSKAIKEYIKATLGDRPRPMPKPRRKNRRTSTGAASVEHELRTLVGSNTPPAQSRPTQPHSRRTGATSPKRDHSHSVAAAATDSEKAVIQVSAEPLPIPASQSVGVSSSQDSSHQSKSATVSHRSDDSVSVSRTKRLSISSETVDFEEEELMLNDDGTRYSEDKSEDFVAASSVATSDDASWYSQPVDHNDDTASQNQRPFLATSLYQIVSKNSSRSLGESGSKRPKSESTLRQLTIKPATKLANRAMKKLRKRKGNLGSTSGSNASETDQYKLWHSPGALNVTEEAMNHTNTGASESMTGSPAESSFHSPVQAEQQQQQQQQQQGMPVIKEVSSPESSSSPDNDDIPVPSTRDVAENSSIRSRRTMVVGQSARRRSSSRSITQDLKLEKPSSRRTALERAKAAGDYQTQRKRQHRQRVFKKVIPRREEDVLAKVGGSMNNSFLVFEDPTNSSSSPPSPQVSKRR